MKLTLTQFVTLDGVSQGPGSPTEDTSDRFTRGGWLVPHIDALFVERASEWLDLADGLLLGRRTYEAFARDWPQITDPNDPFTERMNSLPKCVMSNTLANGTWNPTRCSGATQPRRSPRSRRNLAGNSKSTAAPGSATRCCRPAWSTRYGSSSLPP
jgi:hypothetical protein